MRLPTPTKPDVQEFQSLYRSKFGVELPYAEARDRLTHLVQFYFLTKGHERFDHNQRVRERQRTTAQQNTP